MVGRLLSFGLFALLLLTGMSEASSLQKKISTSKKRLAVTRSSYANMDRKLAAIAEQIRQNRRKLETLDKEIAASEKEIALGAVQLKEGEKQLQALQKASRTLREQKERLEERLKTLLTDRFLYEEIIKNKGVASPDDVVEAEAVRQMVRMENEEIARLKKSYGEAAREYENLQKQAKRIRTTIARLKERKEKALREKKERQALAAKLEAQKQAYTKRLKRLHEEETSLRRTLAKLHILKEEEARKRRAKQVKKSVRTSRTITQGEKMRVRTLGSSYQKIAVTHYRGRKTISPVGRARVVKKFGAYTDPIYGIKIYNESVTLRPLKPNAKVKSVLNGKVVFAKDTPILGKVVIVEHKGGLHTIYAKMDKIAPTIRKGKWVKRGYVIGRVEKELMFEVTKKNRHINPLELIRLR
ncbi:MAG: peptidoglycan DD-metalloendopeptidase family protein [Epsilonproteobacteria bacterium]|nr:peptidoglycan DD-metalloendopeptidase family protein [Campylobacterota bacterium]